MLCKILRQGRQFCLDISSLGLACHPSSPCLISSGSEAVDLPAKLQVVLGDMQVSIKLACHCMAACVG